MIENTSDECKRLLLENGVDVFSEIDFEVNGAVRTISFEYIVDTYSQASKESQLVFVLALQKSISAKGMGVEKFFEGMGQLLLMTHLSDKLEV